MSSEGLTLNVKSTIPNHNYPAAGIKINTPGYAIAPNNAGCSSYANGYCLFPVNNTQPASIALTGPGAGNVNFTLCLNGKGSLSCQDYNINYLIPLDQGSFELPTLSDNGWQEVDQAGSSGTISIYSSSDTVTPLSGMPILAAPPCGSQAAIADQASPTSSIIYRDVFLPMLPLNYKYTLSFEIGIYNPTSPEFNPTGAFYTPQSLDKTVIPNQQVRVDLVKPTNDPFTMNASDILLNAFITSVGSPNIVPYTPISVDLPADLSNQTVRLRFAGVDNQFYLTMYVDCVRLVAQPI